MLKIIPYLTVHDAAAAVAFYEKAFGAICLSRVPSEDGRLLNAILSVDDVQFMLMDEFLEYTHPNGIRSLSPKTAGGGTAAFHWDCKNTDEVDARYRQVMAQTGALSATEPQIMFWGDYYASVADPFGHQWSFGVSVDSKNQR